MAHLYAAYKCCMCWEIPDTGPLHVCPQKHRHCTDCFKRLQRNYRGSVNGGANCFACKYSGKFEKCDVDSDLIKKLKVKPPIRRPLRYIPPQKLPHELYETKSQGDGFLRSSPSLSYTNLQSKKPLRCLHNQCGKSVAITSLVNHFKYEHPDVPRLNTGRGEELCLAFDVSLIEHNRTFCMAMITAYEFTKIDILRSKSSQSVIKTCARLSGKVPINTFWVMASGSSDCRRATSYVSVWLYSNSDDRYSCTMEVASKNEKVAVSSLCNAVSLHESCDVADVAESLNCLFVSHGSLLALLREGDEVDLKVTVH